jgi:mycothiol maleylpyruvate isomerase-like protein
VDVDRLLAEEEAGWRELHAAFDTLPTERFEEPGVNTEGWTPKDLMFHVGAWCAECGIQLERIAMGTFDAHDALEDETVDSMNRAWLETSRTLDLPTVLAGFHAARTRMMQAWQALDHITADAWEWFEESGPLHYAEHLRELRGWLEDRP